MPDMPEENRFQNDADRDAVALRSKDQDRDPQAHFDKDVVVVGGCGHVGLPLGLAFADRGLTVTLFDINADAVANVAAGRMPFQEKGAEEVLRRVIGSHLTATVAPDLVKESEYVVVVIGTPVDEHLNPDPASVSRAVTELGPYLVDGQLLVLRSTLYPGTTALVEHAVAQLGKRIDVAFCPERIAEGKAMSELYELPQIISARTDVSLDRAEKLFGNLASRMIRLTPEEAELAKLFTNTWRYIKFATANQLFMMATDFGLDYGRIRHAATLEYPRAADLPGAGFAAGPCLLKDTMQLAAFNNNNFVLGHAAMMVNEGLPLYMVSRLEKAYPLADMTVGILGMAFKEESDDTRSSLSYKLKRILRFKASQVLCHDPFVTTDRDLSPLGEVLEQSDILLLATPHRIYDSVQTDLPVIDIWGRWDKGSGL
jgi:UDP-N-acetyl-D-mannosaminuronic acid dehydrogenase